jgi:glycosyltransferase 2 family protein
VISETSWRWLRLIGGVAILAMLAARVGTRPFVDALSLTHGPALLTALVITAGTTLCCAWRWRVIALRFHVDLSLGAAVAAYYRSQFLNAVLPGGVIGDVHRAVRHGSDVGDLGGSARSVAWERCAGQGVQVGATAAVLVLLPSSVRSPLLLVVIGALVLLPTLTLLVGSQVRGRSGVSRALRAVATDLRQVLLAPGVRAPVVVASILASAGHVAVFLVAARAAGVTAPLAQLLPLALVVLLASAVPLNVAGWGPREGAAAWAFGTAGLGIGQGVTVSVVYGVMALVATIPGAVLLVRDRRLAVVRLDASGATRV